MAERNAASSAGTLPVAGVALLLGTDRFMSWARALTHGVATVGVANGPANRMRSQCTVFSTLCPRNREEYR